jgi:tetratricopeptide (TPR) repeat protein
VNYLTPESRAVRVVDQLLDLILIAILLGAPLIFYTRGHDVFEFNKLTAVRVLSCLAAVLYLGKLLYVRPLSLTRHALDLPVAGWLLVCLVATFNTVSWRLSVHGVYEDFEGITTWINYIFLFYLAGQHIRSERQIRLVLGAVALAGTVMGFYGLLQNFGIDFVPWNPDTYSKTRMFSTMGNPNFLAAYCVMSMPIAFALFLELPERVRTHEAFCAVLILLGAVASVGLCSLFNVNYFNFDPSFYDTSSVASMLVSQKFIVTKVLLAFPLIAAVLLYFGRVKWILLLSLLFQLVSVLFTKSRGGVFSIALLVALFVGAFAWDLAKAKGLLFLAFVGAVVAAAAKLGALSWAFQAAFVDHRLPFFIALVVCLWLLLRLAHRTRLPIILKENFNYLVGLIVAVWLGHYVFAIRDTTQQMLDRTGSLFDSHGLQYTPRLFIWRSALAMMRDNFFFGKGLDTFQISFPPYRLVLYWILEWNGTPEKAHNFFMQTAATMGFVGLIAFVWIFATFTWRSVVDWAAQRDDKRRLMILACFGAVAAFALQNLFSFTVVGYGSLWWILMGFMPAMALTWKKEEAALALAGAGAEMPQALPAAPAGAWMSPGVAWKGGVGFLALALLACAVAGPSFFATDTALLLRWALGLVGLTGLLMLLAAGPSRSPGTASHAVWVVGIFGGLFFAWHSTRIWVADSFYKQGQVGVSVNQVGYAAAMYQKAAGRLKDVTAAQLNSIHLAETPTSQADYLQIEPGLNPDQELYWVKMGIAFESAAAGVQPADQSPAEIQKAKDLKLTYFRTALAIHQYTLEMNPINGYNFNNKGRVLKSMGEAFNDPNYYLRALEHYDRAIALDENNAYFNLDKANTLLNLGRTGEAFDLCQKMSEKFVDFAVPRSYQGFIKMRAGDRKAAIKYFSEAVKLDWKGDQGSRALAATNLGILEGQDGDDAASVEAYKLAIASNPGFPDAYLNLANQDINHHRLQDAYMVLQDAQKAVPSDPRVAQQLARFAKK